MWSRCCYPFRFNNPVARAYNTVQPASGKILSGGVDATSTAAKRFFGAAKY